MGLGIAAGFATLAWLALWVSRACPRLALELCAAALLAGLAGYAWQGSPDMPGHPVTSPASALIPPER